MPTPVEGVVSVKGSIETAPDLTSGEELIQKLTVAMMDKGTRARSKSELAEFLENRGATTAFSSDGIRLRFTARCLSDDLKDVLGVLFEQLASPGFDTDEFSRVRQRIAANVAHRLTHTATRASRMLSRRLYPPGHPNYVRSVEAELSDLHDVDIRTLRAYHSERIAANNMNLVVVGDLPEDIQPEEASMLPPGWNDRPGIDADSLAGPGGSGIEYMDIPDRPNLDVRMGHRLDIRRLDDDYLPLYAGVFALGGNFSSRLMSVVRDELGLTYGIRSGLSGVDRYHTGHWVISVTLSADRLDEGIDASRRVTETYLDDGITEDELESVKTTLIGAYEVQMETTRDIASVVLSNLERGYEMERLDRLPEEVQALTTDRVNGALRSHLSMDRLHICIAGTRAQHESA
jgi:predicted Zn-dependent peptidase